MQRDNQFSVLQQRLICPVAKQVRGSRQGGLVGPLPPLCVIQSPVIGGGKEKGDTKPMTESRGEKEGVSSGH